MNRFHDRMSDGVIPDSNERLEGADGLTDADLGELAALADGTLAGAERDRVLARVEASPRLQELVSRQRASIEAIAALDDAAPQALHARIEAICSLEPEHEPAVRSRRPRLSRLIPAGGLAAALAAVALFFVISSGSDAAPTIGETANLAALGPARSGPAVDPADPPSARRVGRWGLISELRAGVRLPTER